MKSATEYRCKHHFVFEENGRIFSYEVPINATIEEQYEMAKRITEALLQTIELEKTKEEEKKKKVEQENIEEKKGDK